MLKENEQKLINRVSQIKKEFEFLTVDAHLHPFDVMGVHKSVSLNYSESISLKKNIGELPVPPHRIEELLKSRTW